MSLVHLQLPAGISSTGSEPLAIDVPFPEFNPKYPYVHQVSLSQTQEISSKPAQRCSSRALFKSDKSLDSQTVLYYLFDRAHTGLFLGEATDKNVRSFVTHTLDARRGSANAIMKLAQAYIYGQVAPKDGTIGWNLFSCALELKSPQEAYEDASKFWTPSQSSLLRSEREALFCTFSAIQKGLIRAKELLFSHFESEYHFKAPDSDILTFYNLKFYEGETPARFFISSRVLLGFDDSNQVDAELLTRLSQQAEEENTPFSQTLLVLYHFNRRPSDPPSFFESNAVALKVALGWATKGHLPAIRFLHAMLRKKYDLSQCPPNACIWQYYHTLIKEGEESALLALSYNLIRLPNFRKKGLEILINSAAKGSLKAQRALSTTFRDLFSIDLPYSKTIPYLSPLQKYGIDVVCLYLGKDLMNGVNELPRDREAGLRLLLQAANHGHQKTLEYLQTLFLLEMYHKIPEWLAFAFYSKLFEEGEESATFYFGKSLLTGAPNFPKNPYTGRSILNKLSHKGYLPAQLFLIEYVLNKGNTAIPAEKEDALNLLHVAAEQKQSPKAQFLLARYLENDPECTESQRQYAQTLYEKSAAKGYKEAEEVLGDARQAKRLRFGFR